MNVNAPLASILKVEIYRQTAEIGLVLGANLGDIDCEVTVRLGSEHAVACAHALRQAERLLAAGKPGHINCRPSTCIVMDIELDRGGIVLTVHMDVGEHCFFLHGSSTISQCAEALFAMALKLQMPNQEKITWH